MQLDLIPPYDIHKVIKGLERSHMRLCRVNNWNKHRETMPFQAKQLLRWYSGKGSTPLVMWTKAMFKCETYWKYAFFFGLFLLFRAVSINPHTLSP